MVRRILALAAAAVILAACGSPDPAPAIDPTLNPDTVAAAFAEAWSTADTPAACALMAPGPGLDDVTRNGWCGTRPEPNWSTTHWTRFNPCTLFNGVHAYAYATNTPIQGRTAFVVQVDRSGDQWRVYWVTPSENNFCTQFGTQP